LSAPPASVSKEPTKASFLIIFCQTALSVACLTPKRSYENEIISLSLYFYFYATVIPSQKDNTHAANKIGETRTGVRKILYIARVKLFARQTLILEVGF